MNTFRHLIARLITTPAINFRRERSEIWPAKYFIRDRNDHSSYSIRGMRDLFTLSLPLLLLHSLALCPSPSLPGGSTFLSTFSRVFLCWRLRGRRRPRKEERIEEWVHTKTERARERGGRCEKEKESGTHPSIKRRADSGLSFGLRSPHDSFFDNHSLSCSRGMRGTRRASGDRRRYGGTPRGDGGNLQAGKYRSVVDWPF